MRKFIFFLLFIVSGFAVSAQLYRSAFHVGWNTLVPLSNRNFIDRTSSAGARIGFTKFINDRFGFGLEGGYSTLDDYIPLQVYEQPTGAISTDVYNYHYYFTILANAQYYFTQGNKFIPYVSMGMGMAFSEYRAFYNVFEGMDNQSGILLRPEVGTYVRFKEYARWGFKSTVSYDFAATESDYFGTGNFSGLSIQVGVVLFSD